METHMQIQRICVIASMILLSTSLAQAQPTLTIPVPLPAAGVQRPLGAASQEMQEPNRWTQEDITLDEQYATAKKETMAAYQDALDECKGAPAAERASCVSVAKSEMEREMAKIRHLFGLSN
jgi:hypothetical protein